MAISVIARYVWLINILIQHKKLTYKQISRLWEESRFDSDKRFPLRTFHNHRQAIADIFAIDIECNKQNQYYIEDFGQIDESRLYYWIIGRYSVLNKIRIDRKDERELFKDIPFGGQWLIPIIQSIKEGKNLFVSYKGHEETCACSFEIKPYCLKIFQHRWYVLAQKSYYSDINRKEKHENCSEGGFKIYELDCILDIEII